MPRRKYSTQQQTELDLLAKIHQEKVQARAVIKLRIEAELRDALNDLELKESRQANVCMAAGITKTDVGRSLGTANFETIKATLARTSLDVVPERTVDAAERFTFAVHANGNTYVKVDMAGQEWDEYVESIEHTFRRGADLTDMHAGEYWLNRSTRTVSGALNFEKDATTPNTSDNPVTSWIKYGPGVAELRAAYEAYITETEPLGSYVPEDDDEGDEDGEYDAA